eukprot:2073839-Rhodomonas_salina.4
MLLTQHLPLHSTTLAFLPSRERRAFFEGGAEHGACRFFGGSLWHHAPLCQWRDSEQVSARSVELGTIPTPQKPSNGRMSRGRRGQNQRELLLDSVDRTKICGMAPH